MSAFEQFLYNLAASGMLSRITTVAIVYLIDGLVFSFVCSIIMKNKGYSNSARRSACIGGFFLGPIWAIVCVRKQDAKPIRYSGVDVVLSVGTPDARFWLPFLSGGAVSLIGCALLFKTWWGLAVAIAGIIVWIIQYATIGKSKQ